MGTVLDFYGSHRPARPQMRAGAARSGTWGEIVIFPGVRIERHAENASGLDLAARIGRKQDGSPVVAWIPRPAGVTDPSRERCPHRERRHFPPVQRLARPAGKRAGP